MNSYIWECSWLKVPYSRYYKRVIKAQGVWDILTQCHLQPSILPDRQPPPPPNKMCKVTTCLPTDQDLVYFPTHLCPCFKGRVDVPPPCEVAGDARSWHSASRQRGLNVETLPRLNHQNSKPKLCPFYLSHASILTFLMPWWWSYCTEVLLKIVIILGNALETTVISTF